MPKTKKPRPSRAKEQKDRRNLLTKDGLCIESGCGFPVVTGTIRCSIHLAKFRTRSKTRYHEQRLKDAGLAQHEYELRRQMAGGNCEGCGLSPITHFNFGLKNRQRVLRLLTCRKCDRTAREMTLGQLTSLLRALESFYKGTPQEVLIVDRAFKQKVEEFMRTLPPRLDVAV